MVAGPKIKTAVARNQAAYAAIDYKADYLLMIDDDMISQPTVIEALLRHDVDIAVPLFFRATPPIEPLVYDLDELGSPVPILKYPKNALFECPGGAGTGMMLIKTDVLKALQENGPVFNDGGNEDIEFCAAARKLGYRTWCDSSQAVSQMGLPRAVGISDYRYPVMAKRAWTCPPKDRDKVIEYTLDNIPMSNVGHAPARQLTAIG
jgi:hypothetical protein